MAPVPRREDPVDVPDPSGVTISNGRLHNGNQTESSSPPREGEHNSGHQDGRLDEGVRSPGGVGGSGMPVPAVSPSLTPNREVDDGEAEVGVAGEAGATGGESNKATCHSTGAESETTMPSQCGEPGGDHASSAEVFVPEAGGDSATTLVHPWITGLFVQTLDIGARRRRRELPANIDVDVPEEAEGNSWYEWAKYTAGSYPSKDECYVCAQARPPMIIIPTPYRYEDAVLYYDKVCKECSPEKDVCRYELESVKKCVEDQPVSPFECVISLGTRDFLDRRRQEVRTISHYESFKTNTCGELQKWPESAPEIIPRYLIGKGVDFDCFSRDGTEDLGKFPGECKTIWDISKYYRNMQIMTYTDDERRLMAAKYRSKAFVYPWAMLSHQNVSLADVWWACGPKYGLRNTLPKDWGGLCARVAAMQDSAVLSVVPNSTLTNDFPSGNKVGGSRKARSVIQPYKPDPQVYLDPIGQPRGIPPQYKIRSEVAAGFEALIPTIGVSKLWEVSNYLYYNQQRFLNYSIKALGALGQQLDATSKTARDNRLALDFLLAEQGGLCAMIGSSCCTFIPMNTAENGSFSAAMKQLQDLSVELSVNSGRDAWLDQSIDHWIKTTLGPLGAVFAKAAVLVGGVLLVVSLLFCCLVPCLRSLVVKISARQLSTQMALQGVVEVDEDEEDLIGVKATAPLASEEFLQHAALEILGPQVFRAAAPSKGGK
ncbi:uncharacterized protein LOC134438485 isoform X3 [Engraulis encrasicolus]|uniref:uncharacterized protein LOC134438485 isoform X3 n=1 Tax=Engraulis encrasicolus TaxID=184585 RepID=UPI002FD043BF